MYQTVQTLHSTESKLKKNLQVFVYSLLLFSNSPRKEVKIYIPPPASATLLSKLQSLKMTVCGSAGIPLDRKDNCIPPPP